MSNQAERVISRLRDDQHSAEARLNIEGDLEIPIDEGNNSVIGETLQTLSRLSSNHNSVGHCRRCYSDCGDLRVATSMRITIVDDDNPPPYSALIPQNHAAWFYEFPTDISHARNTTALERFQQRLTSSNAETCPNRTRPHSLDAIPLTAFGICKENPPRSALETRSPENLRIAKVANLPRRYGTILVAGIVVVSLMALSLIVRLIVERSFWRS